MMVDHCLRKEIHTIDIDLTAPVSRDVSGPNAFLPAACTITVTGKSLFQHHPSPAMIHPLNLTRTDFPWARRPRHRRLTLRRTRPSARVRRPSSRALGHKRAPSYSGGQWW
jgi:hypothetical protein